MDWSTVSDDEFVEEAQRRVNQGHWSPDRYMSKLQSNDRAKLDKLRSAVISANVASIHSGEHNKALSDLALLCDHLDATTGHPPEQAFAVNTTFYGRQANEDHSPK